MTQTMTDKTDPIGAAHPIGKSESVKYTEAKYARGILTNRIEIALCRNDRFDRP